MGRCNQGGPRGFGRGPWGGAGVLPWGGAVPKATINKGLRIRAYKAVRDADRPKRPKGFKAVRDY
jgi:hypothetical protein